MFLIIYLKIFSNLLINFYLCKSKIIKIYDCQSELISNGVYRYLFM